MRDGRLRCAWWLAAVMAMAALVLLPAAATGQERVPRFERFVGLTAQPGFLNDPYGVAVSPADDGRAFVVDRGNARIQVFSPTGQALGTWGSRGNGRHQFWLPSDVAVSLDGRYVYVLDQGRREIKRFEPAPDCFPPGERECFTDSRTVVFGYYGQLMDPTGLAIDRQGRVLVTDTVLHRVLVFDADGLYLDKDSFGEPGSGPDELLNPTDVAVHPDGTIWVADTGNNRISFFTPDGQYKGQWTGGGRNRELFHPTGIAIDRDGRFIVRDFERSYQLPQAALYGSGKQSMWTVSLGDGETQGVYAFQGAAFLPDGTALLTDPAAEDAVLIQVLPNGQHSRWGATRGRHPLQLDRPLSVALDEQLLGVVDAGNRRAVIVQRLPEGEKFLTVLGPPLKPEFELVSPQGVAIHRSGPEMDEAVVYVTDAGSHSVWVSSPTGDRLARWGDGNQRSGPDGLKAPHGIAVAPDGDVYIADTGNNRIVRRAGYPRDEVLAIIGRTGDGPGELEFPRAVAYGPGDRVFVLETVKNRLQAFRPDGTFIAGSEWDSGQAKNVEPGELWMPQALASDGQYLYILECDAPYDHVRVQVVDPQPGVPLADSLVATFADWPGPGPDQVWDPHGLAAAGGAIAVADTGNNRLALYRWQDEREAPTTTLTATPEPATATPTPTDEPATATPELETASPEPETATPELETATATVTVAPATDTPEPTPLTPSPTSSSLPSPTPSATSTAPATATGAVSPSATSTDPPSANTRPTPFGGGRWLYMPLTVKSFRVGTKWR